jgi:hypothetical protein
MLKPSAVTAKSGNCPDVAVNYYGKIFIHLTGIFWAERANFGLNTVLHEDHSL